MAHSSKFTVLFALGGNSFIALAKYSGWFFSGSGAMLSEAFHSTADVLNQAFLFVGLKRSERTADELYNYGYGKANFFWSFISALGIFFFGAGLTIYHGIHGLRHPDYTAPENFKKYFPLILAILLINLIVDLISLWIAVREINSSRKGAPFWKYLKDSPNPTAIAIFLEDVAACLGVLLALLAIILTILLKSPHMDAVCSLLIGLIMGYVSIFLMMKTKGLLVGKAVQPKLREKLLQALQNIDSIEKVKGVKSMVISAEQFHLKAKIDFRGAYFVEKISDQELQQQFAKIKNYPEFKDYLKQFAEELSSQFGLEVDKIEQELKKQFPGLTHLESEPSH